MPQQTTTQLYLMKITRYWIMKNLLPLGYTVTKDDGHYYHIDNKRRFIQFNFLDYPEKVIFVNIQEDGATRTSYNGFYQTLDQLKMILGNLW